ncbi:asparaginase domain-containing protein [Arthrobacter sp. NPDC058288]|uniref:asparaginase domain-containing protein n=1 Tax=Arthrobacter sp. NPDC058288 TaxID=3346424 RepID=UPI0036EE2842
MAIDTSAVRRVAEEVGRALADPGTDGVAVTHGTDTLEETAFLLDLVHGSPKPVVVTGAQHTADSPEADGPRNVAEAVRAAADQQLRGAGALICFNGTVLSARGARKVHTTASSPFGHAPPLPAAAAAGHVRWHPRGNRHRILRRDAGPAGSRRAAREPCRRAGRRHPLGGPQPLPDAHPRRRPALPRNRAGRCP